MKKTQKVIKTMLVLPIVFVLIFFTACVGSYTNNIRNIKTETDSVYSFVTSNGITIGSKYYAFEDLACSTARYSKPDTGYPHWYDYRDDKTLFLYELKNVETGSNDKAKPGEYQNYHKFDLGLFSVDNKTGDCTMLGLYKDVYPTYLFRYTYQKIVYGTSDKHIILFYNGRVEVLDIASRTIVYSRQFFAEDAFKNHYAELPNSEGRLPYDFTDDNDLVIYENNKIKLYKFLDGKYSTSPIEIDYSGRFEYTNKIEDILYTYYYEGDHYNKELFIHFLDRTYPIIKYELIYNIESGLEVSQDDLLTLLRKEKARIDFANRPRLCVGNDIFNYDGDNYYDDFTITRESDGKSIALSTGYLEEKSDAYVKLIKNYKPGDTVYLYAMAAYAVEGKLLIACRGSTPGIYLSVHTPRFYFELDFESGDVYYAGFSEHGYYNAEKITKH